MGSLIGLRPSPWRGDDDCYKLHVLRFHSSLLCPAFTVTFTHCLCFIKFQTVPLLILFFIPSFRRSLISLNYTKCKPNINLKINQRSDERFEQDLHNQLNAM